MKISIFLDLIDQEKALTRFISERTLKALARHRDYIERVEIRVRDVNGLKGGIDKECKILIATSLPAPVVITARHTDAGQAFRAAIKRVKPNLRARLDKANFREKRSRATVRSIKEAA